MKIKVVSLDCFFVGLIVFASAAQKNLGAQEKTSGTPAASAGVPGAGVVEVTTTDGSVFRGTITGGSITTKTAFGELKIDGARIRSVSGPTLILDDGSTLHGSVVGGELRVASPYGLLTIPGQNVKEVRAGQQTTLSAPALAPVAPGKAGQPPVPSGQVAKGPGVAQQAGLTDTKIGSGLKEALKIGAENAVNLTGRTDGYFRNEAIKILMPAKLRTMEKTLRAVGYGSQLDEFVLSMNRAAEQAAPLGKKIFWDAIGEMTFEDARKILSGNETAATAYFKSKSSDKLAKAFRPVVEQAMKEVGVARQYQELVGRFQLIPFVKSESVDINDYVVSGALDGLFHVLGEEERKIRTNPATRVTSLLKEVFGK